MSYEYKASYGYNKSCNNACNNANNKCNNACSNACNNACNKLSTARAIQPRFLLVHASAPQAGDTPPWPPPLATMRTVDPVGRQLPHALSAVAVVALCMLVQPLGV